MITDIFSSFDPTNKTTDWLSQNAPSMAWILPTLPAISLSATFWVLPSLFELPLHQAHNVTIPLSTHSKSTNLKAMPPLLSSLFILLSSTNLMGLLPYSFSPSSHMLFSSTFALPLWLAIIISSLALNILSFLSSLLPSGAPNWLNPFLLGIEMSSISARPLTLSFRLAANISTGHILLTLIGTFTATFILSTKIVPTALALLAKTGYTAFELAIAIMQAYIFTLLPTLYANEHTT